MIDNAEIYSTIDPKLFESTNVWTNTRTGPPTEFVGTCQQTKSCTESITEIELFVTILGPKTTFEAVRRYTYVVIVPTRSR